MDGQHLEKRENKQEGDIEIVPPRSHLYSEKKVSDFLEDSSSGSQNKLGRHSVEVFVKRDNHRKAKDTKASSSTNSNSGNHCKDGSHENEYKKGLRHVLWLSTEFPLQTEELLPVAQHFGK
ncbi:unnamed protein product [Fraxinus pennsylvanica]|uniref:Ankyrin repeat domain-containing protein n=1 Tax=Fraxinus pennsylvanica TaxID=56036 RepID=A0AAD1YSJ1_9LAMI|nr:unnamed protein product [Fraxinus pennsylvanica]